MLDGPVEFQGSITELKRRKIIRQVHVLTKRTVKVTLRDPLGLLASMIEAIAMGLVLGYIFHDLVIGSQSAHTAESSGGMFTLLHLHSNGY